MKSLHRVSAAHTIGQTRRRRALPREYSGLTFLTDANRTGMMKIVAMTVAIIARPADRKGLFAAHGDASAIID